jgi:hypothetical protein
MYEYYYVSNFRSLKKIFTKSAIFKNKKIIIHGYLKITVDN